MIEDCLGLMKSSGRVEADERKWVEADERKWVEADERKWRIDLGGLEQRNTHGPGEKVVVVLERWRGGRGRKSLQNK